jgi:catechol 2,3-dioxygenase-like lactoylglutathione lyase family enzyme
MLTRLQSSEEEAHRVRRFHHFGITVAKLERSLGFYRDLLGMKVLGISDEEDVSAIVAIAGARMRAADVDAGNGQVLELLEYTGGSTEPLSYQADTAGSCHVALEVGELSPVLSRLAEAGFLPIGEVESLAEGGVWEGCTVVYLRDPDGVIVELVERSRGA